MKTKIIPFNIELAKKIQAGEIEGRIMTGPKETDVTIISFNRKGPFSIVGLIDGFIIVTYNTEGYSENCVKEVTPHRLCIEVPDNEPQFKPFKPFDEVLARNHDDEEWETSYFSHIKIICDRLYYIAGNIRWKQCIPYEGNEHLVGTTDKPKED